MVPSVWRHSLVTPFWKRGDRRNPSNYRPIVLASCMSKLLERLILRRVSPLITQSLDPAQVGFLAGADMQVYALRETLRLRGPKRTSSAFIDLRDAFGWNWLDASLLRLHSAVVSGCLWALIDDMFSDGQLQMLVNGELSAFWESHGIRQGRVRSPFPFYFDY